MESQELLNGRGRAIAAPDPDDLGRMAEEETSLMKICVFADDGEALSGGIVPDGFVGGLAQADVSDVLRLWIHLVKRVNKPIGKILLKEQFHREGRETSLRSRSAANSRHARMSSRVRSGKSVRMSASLMPEARYSRMSYTVMRSPRMQGFPPRLAGSMVMRSWYDMMGSVPQGCRKIKGENAVKLTASEGCDRIPACMTFSSPEGPSKI